MPALLAARAREKRLRIWCTACATGQEPYSLAMSLKGFGAALAGWRIEIVATDLSNDVLDKAKAGIYSQFEVQRGLPIQLLVKFFAQVGDAWQIVPEIRAMVKFRPLNLLNDFSALGTFDLVFCRNVLIYFDQNWRAQPHRAPDACRWLSGSGRRRNRGRPHRRVQADARETRALRTERRRCQARARQQRAEVRGEGVIPFTRFFLSLTRLRGRGAASNASGGWGFSIALNPPARHSASKTRVNALVARRPSPCRGGIRKQARVIARVLCGAGCAVFPFLAPA
jgi:hypothetical protein